MGKSEKRQKKAQGTYQKIPPFTSRQTEALDGNVEMTYELFMECLEVCVQVEDVNKYFEIWDKYPECIEELRCRGLINSNKSMAQESWERFKTMMREEYGQDFI